MNIPRIKNICYEASIICYHAENIILKTILLVLCNSVVFLFASHEEYLVFLKHKIYRMRAIMHNTVYSSLSFILQQIHFSLPLDYKAENHLLLFLFFIQINRGQFQFTYRRFDENEYLNKYRRLVKIEDPLGPIFYTTTILRRFG